MHNDFHQFTLFERMSEHINKLFLSSIFIDVQWSFQCVFNQIILLYRNYCSFF